MIAAIDAAKQPATRSADVSSFASTGCRSASGAIASRISDSTAFWPARSWACRRSSRRDRPRRRGRGNAGLASARRLRARRRERRAAEQSRRRHRGRHEQRRADRRARLGQTDSDADESVAVGESSRGNRRAGDDRAQRRLRRPRGRDRRRGDGAARVDGPVLEKYGGDSMEETLDNLRRSREGSAGSSRANAR